MTIITLLTDFGTTDYYVGALKGVLLTGAPSVTLVDITHDVAPGDVAGAAFLLGAASRHFPRGTVHLAVVDPGVGSDRRILAVESARQLYVAPDNGLLTPILEDATVHSVTRSDLFRDAPGETFHGRDRMAPAAAALARGEPLSSLGPEIPDPVRLAADGPRRESSVWIGRVTHIDRFGNLVTDFPNEWYRGESFRIALGNVEVRRFVSHYAELAKGEPGLLPGSLGTLELSLRGDSLAGASGAQIGSVIQLLLD